MIVNQFFLSLFFLYFVLISAECSQLMNCNLQRFINKNTWTKHLMLLLSIYIFTFILNWYTIESILEENFSNMKPNIKFNDINKKKYNNTHQYLVKSFYYSILIYVIFLLSTKNEGIYAFIFLFSSILIVIGTIYCKSINSDIYLELNNKFLILNKTKNRLLEKYKNNTNEVKKIVLLQNIIFVIFVILVLILIFGTFKYYKRQCIEHQKDWSLIKFWFGYKNDC